IAEGSLASGTSKKTELKLTNVARASLEELRLDYQDFLRQRGLEEWKPEHPALARFKAGRVATMEGFAGWVQGELARTNTDEHRRTRAEREAAKSVSVRGGQWRSAELAANGALSLLNVCCHLLDRQLGAQADAFEHEGGFTERLFRVRSGKRSGH
ncbi:four helix bundle protein, partial [candidate division WOR-3 bacterium]|nr:four helix bundle protein [candidate division WOR-3 bacterium]